MYVAHAQMRYARASDLPASVSIMERVRLVPVDANIFGVDANTVGIKANANVEITDQNILSKSRIDSYQYIHFNTVFETPSVRKKLSNGRSTGFQESKRYRCWGMELFGLSRGESMALCRELCSSPRTTVEDLFTPSPYFYFITLGDSSTGKQRLQLPMFQMRDHPE